MCKDNPDLTKGLRAVAYDMALRSADSDRLMDYGILPITKTPRTSRGKTAAVNLGPHTFKTATGQAEKTSSLSTAPPTSPFSTETATPTTSPSAGSVPKSKHPDPESANTSSTPYGKYPTNLSCHNTLSEPPPGSVTTAPPKNAKPNATPAEPAVCGPYPKQSPPSNRCTDPGKTSNRTSVPTSDNSTTIGSAP